MDIDRIAQITAVLTEIQVSQATLIAGQGATNEHLRLLNGKVATQEGNISTLLLWKARVEGFTGAVNLGWTTVIALLSGTGLTLWYIITKR